MEGLERYLRDKQQKADQVVKDENDRQWEIQRRTAIMDRRVKGFVEQMERVGASKQPLFSYERVFEGMDVMQKKESRGFFRASVVKVETPRYSEKVDFIGMGWRIIPYRAATTGNESLEGVASPGREGIFIRDNGELITYAEPENNFYIESLRLPDGNRVTQQECTFVGQVIDHSDTPYFWDEYEPKPYEVRTADPNNYRELLEYAERATLNPHLNPPFYVVK